MKNSEIVIPMEYQETAVKVAVPLSHLWGTQKPSEYSYSKTRSIRRAIAEKGTQFYIDNPVITGLLPYKNGSIIFLVNGHHRSREAPNHKLCAVPSLLFSHSLLAELAQVTAEEYKSLVETWTAEAILEFEYHYQANKKQYYPPNVLPHVTSVDQVASLAKDSKYHSFISIAALGMTSQHEQ